jgi:4-amino-4-deoxy-L-arabinose transferase-like glycosyltransferase
MIDRAWTLHLTPAGFVLALFGLVTAWRRPRRQIVDAWLGVVLLFIFVTIEGNKNHEFHQLPLIPPAALLFGLAAAPAFDGAWLRKNGGRFTGVAGGAAVLLVVALLSFDYSGVVNGFFRPGGLDMWPIRIGDAIQQKTPPDSLFVTVEYEAYGNNSPVLLYWAHRRGWSFDLAAITPHVIDLLHNSYGARYFVTTVWPAVAKNHPDVVEYLQTKRRIDLPGMPQDTVMYDLEQPAAQDNP